MLEKQVRATVSIECTWSRIGPTGHACTVQCSQARQCSSLSVSAAAAAGCVMHSAADRVSS
jgi:hypothetical protein